MRFTGCKFGFNVQVVHRNGKWQVEVQGKGGFYYHNHDIGPEVYDTYPVARGIQDEIVAAKAATMVELGSKRSKIYDFLIECGENVHKRDVDNMVQSMKESVSVNKDNELTAAEVARFAAKNPGNSVTVDETAAGETGVLSLTPIRIVRQKSP